MNKNLSAYLDLMRFVASLLVFIGHSKHFLDPRLGPVAGNASEAVAVFFVLSGFVICFATEHKEQTCLQYIRARAVRLFSAIPIAIAAFLVLDEIGKSLNQGYYNQIQWYHVPSVSGLFSYLTFSNEIWFRHEVVGTDEPYWSLGFEVMYYAFFAAVVYAKGFTRVLLATACLLLCGPKVAAFLPLWLVGVVAYRICSDQKVGIPWLGSMFLALSGVLLAAILSLNFNGSMFSAQDVHSLVRPALYFTSIGLCVGMNIIGLNLIMVSRRVEILPRTTAIIRWLAGGSFTLYLIHEPAEILVRAIWPNVVSNDAAGISAMVIVLIGSYGLAEFGERRKMLYRRVLDAVIRRLDITHPPCVRPSTTRRSR